MSIIFKLLLAVVLLVGLIFLLIRNVVGHHERNQT